MTPTERERIEKEASDYADQIYSRDNDRLHWQNRRNGYLAGAISEHDKARNQAIQDCIDIVSITPGDENIVPKLEQLKTIS